jgi:hypothetical protein
LSKQTAETKFEDASALRAFLAYDPETGILLWLPRSPDLFTAGQKSQEHQCNIWNNCYAGKPAFTSVGKNGYPHGTLFCRSYYAHRVIWALMTGQWPRQTIDHVDGDRQNSRWVNLREASRSENARNTPKSSANKSGVKGVCWDTRNAKWLAQIGINGGTKFLGLFSNIEDAANAYAAASAEIHGEFGRLA